MTLNQTKVNAVVSYPIEVALELQEHDIESKFYSKSICKWLSEGSCSRKIVSDYRQIKAKTSIQTANLLLNRKDKQKNVAKERIIRLQEKIDALELTDRNSYRVH